MSWFTLREIIFAAVMAAAMCVIGFIIIPLVIAIPIPGLQALAVAPFYGLLLAVALVRIPKTGFLTLISFFLSVVNSFISPVMGVLFIGSALTAELLAVLLFGGYRSKFAAIVVPGLYMAAMMPLSLLIGVLLARETALADFLLQPHLVVGSTAGSLLLGVAGGWLGQRIGAELNKIAVRR